MAGDEKRLEAADLDPAEARALLEWQLAAGADEAHENRALDRLSAPAPRPTPARPAPSASSSVSRETPSTDESSETSALRIPFGASEALDDARTLAAGARTVAEIEEALRLFEGCELKATATRLCYCDGNPEARIMLIGEAPGAEEDRQGKPFVGVSGRLLDSMLSWIGLDRTKFLITNTIFWRPPGNRTPSAGEIALCRPFVERTIELVQPSHLLLIGGISGKTLLETSEGILKLRGRWRAFRHPALEQPIPALPTLHPAFLLRQPRHKRNAWRDLLSFQRAIRDGWDPLA